MLLRHRPPRIDNQPPTTNKGFEHLDEKWVAVLQWLKANRVDFVLVGAAAEAVRGASDATGPVSIVPAPTAATSIACRARSCPPTASSASTPAATPS